MITSNGEALRSSLNTELRIHKVVQPGLATGTPDRGDRLPPMHRGFGQPSEATSAPEKLALTARRRTNALLGGRRVALYSHDTMGLGHTRRNLLIAQTLLGRNPQSHVLMIAGMHQARAFPVPPRMDFVTLPALHKGEDGRYQSRSLDLTLAEAVSLRSSLILAAVRGFEPDVFIVDNVPRGAARELDPVLRHLRESGGTRCVLGLRDVLDDPDRVMNEWRKLENEQAICDYFDKVWVYGDPSVYNLVTEYNFSSKAAEKVQFTGYLDPRLRLEEDQGGNDDDRLAALGLPAGPLMLCQMGGGQDGARLAEAFASARMPAGTTGVILTGPFMPAERRQRVHAVASANARMHVLSFTPDPAPLIRRARKVVAMGGYNTACEALSFGKPTLIVPRVSPRLEQLVRATRLNELGLVEMMLPDEATSDALTGWLASDGGTRRKPLMTIDLDGLSTLPSLLEEILV
ncbi:MAG TPA: glycosyltransferase [Candidatus Binataceae bacterium]|nr:glycosyltransferase [Candidatus Binataceae bacterium]